VSEDEGGEGLYIAQTSRPADYMYLGGRTRDTVLDDCHSCPGGWASPPEVIRVHVAVDFAERSERRYHLWSSSGRSLRTSFLRGGLASLINSFRQVNPEYKSYAPLLGANR
jgi:hypothetical protein